MKSNGKFADLLKRVLQRRQLYLLLALPLVYLIIFSYIPMFGVQIAFKNYTPARGIWGSEWVGFKYFIRFFKSYQFTGIIRNTLIV